MRLINEKKLIGQDFIYKFLPLAVKYTGSKYYAMDLLHDVFVRLNEYEIRTRGEYVSLIKTCIAHTYFDEYAKRARWRKRTIEYWKDLIECSLSEEYYPLEVRDETEKRMNQIGAYISRLPDKHRFIIDHYLKGWPMDKIALILEINKENAHQILCRIKNNISKKMGRTHRINKNKQYRPKK